MDANNLHSFLEAGITKKYPIASFFHEHTMVPGSGTEGVRFQSTIWWAVHLSSLNVAGVQGGGGGGGGGGV
jgi:hypothetical protein